MKTKKLIFAALFAALSCVATMIIKIPTPTMGYIHPGDAIVLLSGLLLGPWYGSIAAGIGSMFADIFSGYMSYAPATCIIKCVTALICCCMAKQLMKLFHQIPSILISGAVAELFMVVGYFCFEIFLLGLSTGDGFSAASISAGIVSAAGGIPFNIVQGIFGVVIAALLYPILKKVLHSLEVEA